MKKFIRVKPAHVVAAFTSAMLFLTGCSSSNDGAPQSPSESIQRQIKNIPENNGISYIGDKRTGMCFGVNRFHSYLYTNTTLTRVPCTKEVLALIPNPEDRPSYTPQSMPAPSVEP